MISTQFISVSIADTLNQAAGMMTKIFITKYFQQWFARIATRQLTMVKITSSTYDILGNFLKEETLEVTSFFNAQLDSESGMPEPIVCGIWIKKENKVEPRYLTQDQLDNLQRQF